MISNKKPVAGDVVHFRASMTVALGGSDGKVFHRGEELVLTEQIIEDSKGRDGSSWIDIAGDAQAQVQRYGKQIVGLGPVPEDIDFYNTPGDRASRDIARIRARDAAAAISDPVQRQAAWEAVRAEFGTPATSWSLS
ncbi:hypothetical protein [uncultured Microbacterium sp.]|uniref:hypothetical protein n=1 Tax=uncultured Microbacterium sp. TaxID=191216 RepID=UPI0025E73385|nr:hypothetical protein [uncultured Microbacterium sp.]